MPSWISRNGIWGPAKERTYDAKKNEMYEGLDRAAKDVLEEANLEFLGMDAKSDPQMIEVARQRGLTVDQYFEMNKPLAHQIKAQEEAQSQVVDHKDPPKKRGVKPKGGGVTISGGFGDMPS